MLMSTVKTTACEVSLVGVFLVRIFSHLDWIRSIPPYSVRIRENADQKYSKYEHFLYAVNVFYIYLIQLRLANNKILSFALHHFCFDFIFKKL